MNSPVLMVPGIGDSGPDHWQSIWESADPIADRIRVPDWDRPVCESWVAAIDVAVERLGGATVVVAHSLGCIAFAHWASKSRRDICGALLVAVPDPAGKNFPREATGFSPVPTARLPWNTIVVSSRDDPYGDPAFARSCADAWGSRFLDIGPAGHINSASNLGHWPFGSRLLAELRQHCHP